MTADPIVYCLERLTDYAQFERLATDLMAGTDFPEIEPLGGSGDGGQDALHVHRKEGTVRVFAYSVRHDWKTKLRQDCRRIAEAKHRLDEVVFVSTRAISVQRREELRTEIRDRHGWETEFYDIERLRALLTGPLASSGWPAPVHIRATLVRTSGRRSRISQVSRPHRDRPSRSRSRIRSVAVQPVECRWILRVVPGDRTSRGRGPPCVDPRDRAAAGGSVSPSPVDHIRGRSRSPQQNSDRRDGGGACGAVLDRRSNGKHV